MNQTKPRAMISRRTFLQSSALFGGATLAGIRPGFGQSASPLLTVDSHVIEVNGKAAKVFRVVGPGGRAGLIATEGDRFSGDLLNATGEPLQMHWHGQTRAPFDQDRARPDGGSIAPGGRDRHDFELTPGTHWMHSHNMSEQRLLAAPMIAREKNAGDVQVVVVMLHDFAFRTPEEILAELGGSNLHGSHEAAPQAPAAAMDHAQHQGGGAPQMAMPMPMQMPMPSGGDHTMMGHDMMMPGMMKQGMMNPGAMAGMVHANDVRYDAYLANERTLADPEVVAVDKGSRVRLRIINAGTATAFVISTGALPSSCVAVDGSPCQPVTAPAYPLAQGQRIDLVVTIPAAGGAFPILAQVEAARFQTGIVLASKGATVGKQPSLAASDAPFADLALETRLRAASPLADRPADHAFMVMLGEQPGYRWTLNGRIHGEHQPFEVRQGARVELTFMNPTMMMHPMHIHGHHFQVVGIGGRRLSGAMRDTVIVPPHMPLTVAFDATNKGRWFLHCHHLYHMATGMMTEVVVS